MHQPRMEWSEERARSCVVRFLRSPPVLFICFLLPGCSVPWLYGGGAPLSNAEIAIPPLSGRDLSGREEFFTTLRENPPPSAEHYHYRPLSGPPPPPHARQYEYPVLEGEEPLYVVWDGCHDHRPLFMTAIQRRVFSSFTYYDFDSFEPVLHMASCEAMYGGILFERLEWSLPADPWFDDIVDRLLRKEVRPEEIRTRVVSVRNCLFGVFGYGQKNRKRYIQLLFLQIPCGSARIPAPVRKYDLEW